MATSSSVTLFVLLTIALASSLPTDDGSAKGSSFWKGTPMDGVVEQIYSDCLQNDTIACMKFKVISILDQVLRKDSYQVSESVSVVRNDFKVSEDSQSRGFETPFLDTVQKYLQGHDIQVKLPGRYLPGSKLTFSPRNLDNDELSLTLTFPPEEAKDLSEARKGKLKKVIVPILVFVLLKAMTLIPLAIGVLGLKAWNALQLSFFSFVISIALAIFQLCKKIAADASQAQIGHGPYDAYNAHYARGFESWTPQDLAYRGYQSLNDLS